MEVGGKQEGEASLHTDGSCLGPGREPKEFPFPAPNRTKRWVVDCECGDEREAL